MKLTKEQTAAITALSFGPADVKAAMFRAVELAEMKSGKEATCSAEQYGFLLFACLVDLGAMPQEALSAAMAVWDSFPKNPSALRQILEKTDETGAGKVASSLIAKYKPKA